MFADFLYIFADRGRRADASYPAEIEGRVMVQHCAIDHHLRSEIVERVALDNRDYRPVGSCIYCGSTEDLTDEHIFPRSLVGNG